MSSPVRLGSCAVVVVGVLACGGPPMTLGGPLERGGPFLASTQEPQRTVVFTAHRPPMTLGEPAACGITAYFFDPNGPNARGRNPIAREGDCTLYPPGVDLQIPQQTWLCLGGLSVTVGDMPQTISFCPSMGIGSVGAAGLTAPVQGCSTLAAGAMVSATSGSEVTGDEVDDLDLQVGLPTPVSITSPVMVPIGAWPASGDVDVRWQSPGATSAVVTLEGRGSAGGASTTIVCVPRTNGQVWIPAALLAQSNLRTREARLTVATYADRVRPSMGTTPEYRLSAGFSTSVVLQPGR
jgi:hypothetical protein